MNLKDRIQIIERNKIMDSKGWFLKVITGKEDYLPDCTGEVYLISAKEGACRANHYHKEANEWFTLVEGKALMLIEDIKTKEKIKIELDSENPKTIYVPNNIAHAFQNVGDEQYILVTYTNLLYKAEDTVSYTL